MRLLSLLGPVLAGAVACGRPVSSRPAPAAADSLVLERSICFGFCPAYRVSLTNAGVVHFESRNPGDAAHAASDTVPRRELDTLVARAEREGFFTLPDTIQRDSTLCAQWATDHPGAMVTIFGRARTKTVIHYHGCMSGTAADAAATLARLTAFENAIDSATRAARWIRPSR